MVATVALAEMVATEALEVLAATEGTAVVVVMLMYSFWRTKKEIMGTRQQIGHITLKGAREGSLELVGPLEKEVREGLVVSVVVVALAQMQSSFTIRTAIVADKEHMGRTVEMACPVLRANGVRTVIRANLVVGTSAT
jgi:hypothetical protein